MCSGERGGDEKYDQGKKKNPRKMFISKPKCPRKLSAEREKKKRSLVHHVQCAALIYLTVF